jgi:hypothetical protein
MTKGDSLGFVVGDKNGRMMGYSGNKKNSFPAAGTILCHFRLNALIILWMAIPTVERRSKIYEYSQSWIWLMLCPQMECTFILS